LLYLFQWLHIFAHLLLTHLSVASCIYFRCLLHLFHIPLSAQSVAFNSLICFSYLQQFVSRLF
jgi:hypothetical protein